MRLTWRRACDPGKPMRQPHLSHLLTCDGWGGLRLIWQLACNQSEPTHHAHLCSPLAYQVSLRLNLAVSLRSR